MERKVTTSFAQELVLGSIIGDLSTSQAEQLSFTNPKQALPDFETFVVLKCNNQGKWQDGRPETHYRIGRRHQLKPDQGRGWCWQHGPWLTEQEIEGWAYYQPIDPFNL